MHLGQNVGGLLAEALLLVAHEAAYNAVKRLKAWLREYLYAIFRRQLIYLRPDECRYLHLLAYLTLAQRLHAVGARAGGVEVVAEVGVQRRLLLERGQLARIEALVVFIYGVGVVQLAAVLAVTLYQLAYAVKVGLPGIFAFVYVGQCPFGWICQRAGAAYKRHDHGHYEREQPKRVSAFFHNCKYLLKAYIII